MTIAAIDNATGRQRPCCNWIPAPVIDIGPEAGDFSAQPGRKTPRVDYRMPGYGGGKFNTRVVRGGIALVGLPFWISAVADSSISRITVLRLVSAVSMTFKAHLILIYGREDVAAARSNSSDIQEKPVHQWRRRSCRVSSMRIVAIEALRVTRGSGRSFRQAIRGVAGTLGSVMD